MLNEIIGNQSQIIINTGNILSVNRKAGQKPAEELYDCLKLTLEEPHTVPATNNGEINRKNDDLHVKLLENERDNIKIGAKIFLNQNSPEYLRNAIDKLLNVLNVNCLDNLILAYHPTTISEKNNSTNGLNGTINANENGGNKIITNGTAAQLNGNYNSIENGTTAPTTPTTTAATDKSSNIEWGNGNENAFKELTVLWSILEEYSSRNKICQLGIADLDTDSLIALHQQSTIFKPTIAQINLSACCVVPPPLQEFCNKNDIQLLTHSDPEEILSKNGLSELAVNQYKPSWIARYQIHIKCRGVLAAKGFVIGIEQE